MSIESKTEIIKSLLKIPEFSEVRNKPEVPIVYGVKEYQAYENGLQESYSKEYIVIDHDYTIHYVPMDVYCYMHDKLISVDKSNQELNYPNAMAVVCISHRKFDGSTIELNSYLNFLHDFSNS